ncbi:leucine-rich repeat extensin-like protein 3 isoform X1 [Drosophila teissieri]|uniref:leucine-rich repeat extensin-like protein 3 isoform X1 n=1 Tax=Drosophila teissieri TaxID=7243 RepID=UPI001CB9ECBB|nr:leucine-rich repeat extensin-like protein 3 isoform X1 [Drosophila teissieri]
MYGKFRLLLLMICLLWAQLCRTQDHLKLKKLTSDLVNAIAEANSGRKYGAEWVPSLGQALEEVHITSSRRCFLFDILAHKVNKLCPKPPEYYPPPSYTRPKPPPPPPKPPPPPPSPSEVTSTTASFQPPVHISDGLEYPDGSYFPWCYMPYCPTICHPPYCYPCRSPHCDPKCVPPDCYPPCKEPGCRLPPTCWPPYCPSPCTSPKCIPGNIEGRMASCVPPYCPPPMNCQKPYCPKIYKPVAARSLFKFGACPMRDIVSRSKRRG